ncbi:glycosyltransferase family 2 protein [Leptothoe sp. PORK10 BA2]|uniref:glycosyltransferase family 2 protein n=1 Tax=Leptothoe sp. PORK10 BA2 TaxID=3110254 RepID=UPI002B1F04ED|nr:glycosyltransferase [Leptothoe sp. PORK10 BA2]MEA5465667.1 glycosyltransferase [Leptothoe sp. PORK10 BA2]
MHLDLESINNTPPKVSILLPSLNTFPFLAERLDTILSQTLNDWELVVVDSYSDDGSWELIQTYANKDSRIYATQAPREGVYAGINRCLSQAHGEYVYIATSDDTMTSDCLEKMVAALESQPNCDIAHCCLNIIDETGQQTRKQWNTWDKIKFFGEYINQQHIRLAPYDGILYCALGTMYSSLTQLLIRRNFFEKVGDFRTDFGSHGDFEWGIRVGLTSNTIHVPYYLATWRVHSKQATQNDFIFSAEGQALWCTMIKSAIMGLIDKALLQESDLEIRQLTYCYRFKQLLFGLAERSSHPIKKTIFLIRFSGLYPRVVIHYCWFKLSQQQFNPATYIRNFLAAHNYDRHLVRS